MDWPIDAPRLLAFAGSFFLIAVSPGLCMTLAMSLGISQGLRRTLWMMAGELTGVALVGAAAVLGVGALLLAAPGLFQAFKWLGAAYLFWAGWQSWHAPAPDFLSGSTTRTQRPRAALVLQGFVTAVANPKAWAFMVALLPPFVDTQRAVAPQLLAILALVVVIEFGCLLIYAAGGRALAEFLFRRGWAQWLNRLAGALMIGVGFWLALG